MSDNPERIDQPAWLDDVIEPTNAAWGGVVAWERDGVIRSMLNAIARDRVERQAEKPRRPWADVDSKSDYGAFVQWLANDCGLNELGDYEYKSIYELISATYAGK